MASLQGHYNPWHPELLELNEAQLDAILELYSLDYPKRLKFERKSNRQDRDRVEELAIQWSSRLTGKAQETWRGKVSFKLPEKFKGIRAPRERRPINRR